MGWDRETHGYCIAHLAYGGVIRIWEVKSFVGWMHGCSAGMRKREHIQRFRDELEPHFTIQSSFCLHHPLSSILNVTLQI